MRATASTPSQSINSSAKLVPFRGWTLFIIAIIISSFSFHARAEWKNALEPSGERAEKVILVQDGNPVASILCTDNPTAQDKKAALDLQMWIKEITGAPLPINYGAARGKLILVRTQSDLGDEGYAVKSKHDMLLLWGGKKRGPINAVYALLEEDLGCRFYATNSIRL